MASKRIASPAAVRTWALANLSSVEGLPEGYKVGDRGRLHPAIITAFNKANPKEKYVTGEFVPTRTVTFTRVTEKGRKVPGRAQVDTTKVRAAAVEAGLTLPAKGRLPKAVVLAYAQGNLSALVQKD